MHLRACICARAARRPTRKKPTQVYREFMEELRWVKQRLDDVVDSNSIDVEVLASHLISQSNEDDFKKEGRSMLLGQGCPPEFYKRRINKCLDDIAVRLYGKKRDTKKKQQALSTKNGPLNCLNCGYVNAVPMAAEGGSIGDDYYVFMENIKLTRDQWPSCAACGDKLNEQLRYGDVGDEKQLAACIRTASKLIAFDRQATERTRVVDDQADWYRTNSTSWQKPTFTIDFAGRRVLSTDEGYDTELITTSGVAATGPSLNNFEKKKR
mmetsp:Transcript_20836/g.26994  ORF Transcript_20836/g.26994 Transcript_20836/m.26994 type:complete len:267 (-) Transcript_20836:4094-4894(-)